MEIKYFRDVNHALSELSKNREYWDLSLDTKMYGQVAGFYDEGDLIGCVSFSVYDDELHIYTFELSSDIRGLGYGKECYNLLVSKFKDRINKITLDYLNDSAAAFWTKLGFEPDPYGGSEDAMILYL